ncbi:MAG: hypothetical protein DLM52_11305 [Chthoniobacterales bacterium]|nr:MAG: hypothetical protein DLM52_11305 [Chthoniobacterales bacterium]
MHSARAPAPPPAGDIRFNCDVCKRPLIVDAAAAGMTLNCQHCGGPTIIPSVSSRVSTADQLTDIERKLKENESQRTEVTSYINQLCIQIHRWKLRLQTLNERKIELEAELGALQR